MKLGYVCTNYNNSHFTVDAVESLLKSANGKYEVKAVIVDNRSDNFSVKKLEEIADKYPCVELIRNSENLGYFGGLNCGIHYFRKAHPEFEHLVIGNNDLLFPIDFCQSVQQNIDKLDIHPVVSPDIVTLDGAHQNPHVIKSISGIREFVYDLYYMNYFLAKVILFFAMHTRRFTDRSDEREHGFAQKIYQGHGSCYLIGPKFFELYSELWAPTFLMGEEYFLSKQLSDSGYQTFYEPSINLVHCCNGSLKNLPSKKVWEFGRDAHRTYRKYVKYI